MINTFAPGKLYIAGEYAVVEPGYPAIIVAVNKFITVYLKETFDKGSIDSFDRIIYWNREKDSIILDGEDNGFSYIVSAIGIAEEYVKEKGKKLDFYHIEVDSELKSEEGRKYGLGSSAAIVVATVKAILKYYNIKATEMEIFKLAALANINVNPKGSCGDIAASTFGGWLVYKTFYKDWVLKEKEKNSITDLLKKDWPGLYIDRLNPPKDLKLVVGWTGSPANTINLVNSMEDSSLNKESIYDEFLTNSKKCVIKMIKAFKEEDIEEIQKQILVNRELLYNLGGNLGIRIETSQLKKLCNIALKHGGAAKSSGAGGGDCGIAIFKKGDNLKKLIEEWGKANIYYLPLKVYDGKEE